MPGNIGLPEIAIVLIIALIVFGPKRLPELGRSLGNGIREFKGSLTGQADEEPDTVKTIAAPEPSASSAPQPDTAATRDERP